MSAEKSLGMLLVSALLAAVPLGCAQPQGREAQEPALPEATELESETDAPEPTIHEEDFESGELDETAQEPERPDL